MGPELVTTTQANQLKSRGATLRVKTKNRKKARKNGGKSAARSIEVHARSSDQIHSAPRTATTAVGEATRSPPCNGGGQGRRGALFCRPLSLALSPLLPRGERPMLPCGSWKVRSATVGEAPVAAAALGEARWGGSPCPHIRPRCGWSCGHSRASLLRSGCDTLSHPPRPRCA